MWNYSAWADFVPPMGFDLFRRVNYLRNRAVKLVGVGPVPTHERDLLHHKNL